MTGKSWRFEIAPPAAFAPRNDRYFDTWTEPGGGIIARFYRLSDSIVVTFPGTAEFYIVPATGFVRAVPATEAVLEPTRTLLANSIRPMVANHLGGLNLHGSANVIGGRAAAFVGLSRSGKTTLAGSLARAGLPFLTEDVIDLAPVDEGWQITPVEGPLRLFEDSAAHIDGRPASPVRANKPKSAANLDGALPRASEPAGLSAIYLLGDGSAISPSIEPLTPAVAAAELLRHSFILDVEDHDRLASHFDRICMLAGVVPCRRLDYPRRYDQLPSVHDAILDDFQTV